MHKLIIFSALFAISLAQTIKPFPLPIGALPGAQLVGLPAPLIPQIAPRTLPQVVPQNYRYPHAGAEIPILKQTQDIDTNSGYKWSFSSGNGINFEESATIIPLGPELADKQVRGAYSYVSLEGIPVSVTYHSDATGYHPHVSIHIGQPGHPIHAPNLK